MSGAAGQPHGLRWDAGDRGALSRCEGCAGTGCHALGSRGPRRGGSRCPEPLPSCRVPAVVRKLQEFELPYVSVTSLRDPEFRIILRKR